MDSDTKLTDELTQKIGVLTRRETEARIISPCDVSLYMHASSGRYRTRLWLDNANIPSC